MRRRELIMRFGGAAVVWPLTAVTVWATLSSAPAAAGGAPATAYHGGAYYRALLLSQPPSYWNGGTVWPPTNVYVYTPKSANSVRRVLPHVLPRAVAAPKVLRVPDAYVEAARGATYPNPLWVKTAHGFRLDTSGACISTTSWDRTPHGFRSVPKMDCH